MPETPCIDRHTFKQTAIEADKGYTTATWHVFTFTGTRWVDHVRYDRMRCVFCLDLREVRYG